MTRLRQAPKVGDWIRAIKRTGRIVVIIGKILEIYLGGFEVEMEGGLKRYVTYEHYDIEPWEG
ncbi:MAG: hypothetical protein K0M69_15900 [Youngiibacter sp.]|nr:hypothetical protein [Youngiibacter sp.]